MNAFNNESIYPEPVELLSLCQHQLELSTFDTDVWMWLLQMLQLPAGVVGSCLVRAADSTELQHTWHLALLSPCPVSPRTVQHGGVVQQWCLLVRRRTSDKMNWISKIYVKMFDSCTELPINHYFLTDWNNEASAAVPPCPSLRPCDRVISPPYSDLPLTTRGDDTLAMSGSLSSRGLASCCRVLWIIAFW